MAWKWFAMANNGLAMVDSGLVVASYQWLTIVINA